MLAIYSFSTCVLPVSDSIIEYTMMMMMMMMIQSFIHSFIHYGNLYSASSRLLLRSAPDPYTAKENSFGDDDDDDDDEYSTHHLLNL